MTPKNIAQGIWTPRPHRRSDNAKRICLFIITTTVLLVWLLQAQNSTKRPSLHAVQECAIDNAHADLSFLDSAKPINTDEFLERRERLARALVAVDAAAFVLEPGYTFQYVSRSSLTNFHAHVI